MCYHVQFNVSLYSSWLIYIFTYKNITHQYKADKTLVHRVRCNVGTVVVRQRVHGADTILHETQNSPPVVAQRSRIIRCMHII